MRDQATRSVLRETAVAEHGKRLIRPQILRRRRRAGTSDAEAAGGWCGALPAARAPGGLRDRAGSGLALSNDASVISNLVAVAPYISGRIFRIGTVDNPK